MFTNKSGVVLLVLYVLTISHGRRYNNENSDFLLHEAGSGGNPAEPKRDYVAVQPSNNSGNSQTNAQTSGKRDYVSQFPVLGPHSTSPQPGVTPKPSTLSGKRDYVAPQYPTLKPTNQQTTLKHSIGTTATTSKPSTPSGKRDYVAPQYPTLRPTNPQTGNVKDLVNFFDSQNKNQNGPQKVPSYSSILQGSTGRPGSTSSGSTGHTQPATQSTSKVPPGHTTKPFSYSSVVSGGSGGSNVPTIGTTPKLSSPSIPLKPVAPANGNLAPTPRPVTTVLPSTIVNRNKNNNQGGANGPTDTEIQTMSEELLRKDVNNAFKLIKVNYQEKTTSQSKEDKAPQPLLTIPSEVWNIPTIQKFLPLLDNYERDVTVNEHVTGQERIEENAFMDTIMSTAVIRHLMSFLKEKGYVTPDPKQQRDFLKQLWFNLYSRGKGKISSSGFEHVFVSEFRNDDVLGLHNWIYFSKEESARRVNYLGYLKYLQLSDKGVVIKQHFNQQGIDKPVDSMFIGTSPELEMALYTLCFVSRPDDDCKLKLANKDVTIRSHTFRYRSKNYIGSAFPQI